MRSRSKIRMKCVCACVQGNRDNNDERKGPNEVCASASAQENRDGTDAKMRENEPRLCWRTNATEI